MRQSTGKDERNDQVLDLNTYCKNFVIVFSVVKWPPGVVEFLPTAIGNLW